MTAEKLYENLTFLESLDTKLGLQKNLEAIGTALDNLAGTPSHPQFQESLAQALSSLEESAARMSAAISPTQSAVIQQIGGKAFFDPAIADNVKNSVQMNAMTPSVARDFVKNLVSTRADYLSTVRTAVRSLKQLGIEKSGLKTGSADLAFLIPRDIFDNKLGHFAKELSFISRLIEHYSEAMMGRAEPAELEQLSSSTPTVALLASLPVIAGIGKVVNWFLDAWEKIERIRKIRVELVEMGMKGRAVEELSEQITTTVEEVVEESTKFVLSGYKGDSGRRSELENAIRQDTRRLFGQIERGLTVEFRAETGDGDGEENDEIQEALASIEKLGAELKFPQIAKEPMLLDTGELLEGEILTVKRTRTKETKTSTTTKRASRLPSVGR